MEFQFFLEDENATVNFGAYLSKIIPLNTTIFLEGDLGAGKTTLTRGIVQELGFDGAVKSPTFTLVEEYDFNKFKLFHFDLYRLNDPEELEFMGIRDYFSENSIRLIEWPSHGGDYIPNPDVVIRLEYIAVSRKITIKVLTERVKNSFAKLETMVPDSFVMK